jgi:hypothetical protein
VPGEHPGGNDETSQLNRAVKEKIVEPADRAETGRDEHRDKYRFESGFRVQNVISR